MLVKKQQCDRGGTPQGSETNTRYIPYLYCKCAIQQDKVQSFTSCEQRDKHLIPWLQDNCLLVMLKLLFADSTRWWIKIIKHTCATEPWHHHVEGLDVISASKNLPKLHMSNYTYRTPRSAVKPGIEKLNGVLISQDSDPTNLHEKLPMMGLSRQIYSCNFFPMMTNFWNHSFFPLEGLDPSLQKNRSPVQTCQSWWCWRWWLGCP